MKLSGLLLIFLSLAVPLVWFVPLYQARPDVAFVSQYLGATALIVMAIGLLLSTRGALLEYVFGPLDKIYVYYTEYLNALVKKIMHLMFVLAMVNVLVKINVFVIHVTHRWYGGRCCKGGHWYNHTNR